MTREERENVLHCLKVMIDEEVCEECNLYGTTGTDHCEADCVNMAIKALEQEPRWIPVSDRLPKWGEEVLTIDNDGNYEINFITDDDINEWFYDDIVAWMPLPQPYEPQESEG